MYVNLKVKNKGTCLARDLFISYLWKSQVGGSTYYVVHLFISARIAIRDLVSCSWILPVWKILEIQFNHSKEICIDVRTHIQTYIYIKAKKAHVRSSF